MTGKSEDSEWQKLSWAEKVQICQQAIAIGDTLLLTLVVMLIALEAMLFTILAAERWGQWWSIILAVPGLVYAGFHIYFFEIKGSQLDCWGKTLHDLLTEAGLIEQAKHWEGCVERRKHGRWKVIFGWCEKDKHMGRFKRIITWFKCFKSTRRWFTTFIPLVLVIVWILLIVVSFDS